MHHTAEYVEGTGGAPAPGAGAWCVGSRGSRGPQSITEPSNLPTSPTPRFRYSDRAENIRRVAEVSKLFADGGIVALSSFISPTCASREAARQLHKKDNLEFLLYIAFDINLTHLSSLASTHAVSTVTPRVLYTTLLDTSC